MTRALHTCLALCLALLGLALPASASAAAEPERPVAAASRLFVIADIHGAFAAFTTLLQGLELVDADRHWSGGDAHLVVLGDAVDRGSQSRQTLDLLMTLEREAEAAGGALHLLLGNHEIMNLVGDLRYVSPEDFASYLPEEAPAVREQAFQRFAAGQPAIDSDDARAAFDARFPPGFFGQRAAFAPDGLYGQWLLEKPVLLVLNGSAFVHAGLSPSVLTLEPALLNQQVRTTLRRYLGAWGELQKAGLLFPESAFQQHAELAARLVQSSTAEAPLPAALLAAATALRALWEEPLFDSPSPVWYRGMVACNPALEYGRVQAALAQLGVERLVLGHTPTLDHRVHQRFAGQVLLADTGMLKAYFGGQPAALLLEGKSVRVYYAETRSFAAPVEVPRRVGPRPPGLTEASDDELERLLREAEPQALGAEAEDGWRALTLAHEGQRVEARFLPATGRGRNPSLPAVAAYRLDRLLGLDLVPVAVRREIAGELGTVGLSPDSWPSEEARAAGEVAPPWCPLSDQFELMYAFDRLLHHEGRSPEQLRYDPERGKLLLSGNEHSLGTQRRLPAYLRDAPAQVPDLLAERLAALSEAQLEETLGDVLDERRRAALLRRRDALLELERP